MNKTFTHTAVAIFTVALCVIYFRSCESVPTPKPVTVTTHDTTTIVIIDTVLIGEGKGRTKFTYSGMVHDTVTERVYITTANNDTVSSFTSILDTIQNKDTLHLEYTYPDAMFRYRLNRAPIEVKTVNTTITNTVTTEPPKFSFGLQFGVGYLVSWRTGQSALGSYFGIGCNYKL